jgi:hypothetical protein
MMVENNERLLKDQVFSLRDENLDLKKKLSKSDENARKYSLF